MLVSHSHRMLFVHVQKTGGSSVQRLLTAPGLGFEPVQGLSGARHAKYHVALRSHPQWADYYAFGFVRNPWARMLSWFQMVERRREQARHSPVVAARLATNPFWSRVVRDYPTFEDFVLRGTREVPRLQSAQVDYLVARAREVDFIGRTERLQADLHTVLARTGAGVDPGRLEHRNAGPATDYRPAYTDEMAARVGDVFAADVERFGYRF